MYFCLSFHIAPRHNPYIAFCETGQHQPRHNKEQTKKALGSGVAYQTNVKDEQKRKALIFISFHKATQSLAHLPFPTFSSDLNLLHMNTSSSQLTLHYDLPEVYTTLSAHTLSYFNTSLNGEPLRCCWEISCDITFSYTQAHLFARLVQVEQTRVLRFHLFWNFLFSSSSYI